ncbi:gastrotropin [Hippoglossus stenolepis]|uniref:gastrotropin n=1 Tax=Hippoglossus stenolepis TaxID=195615 RepID=UPI001FB02837|nr:gastrotropin [Hippoglossus stenolepis]
MAFTGSYVVESYENYEEFMEALGLQMPKGKVTEEVVTEIHQNDEFVMTKHLKDKTWCNKFHIGKEAELQTVAGEKFKTTVTLEGGKLKIQFPNYLYTAEVVADKLVEVQTVAGVSAKLISKKTK